MSNKTRDPDWCVVRRGNIGYTVQPDNDEGGFLWQVSVNSTVKRAGNAKTYPEAVKVALDEFNKLDE